MLLIIVAWDAPNFNHIGMLVSPNDVKEVLKNKKQLTFSDFVSLVFVVEQKSMRKSSGAGQTTPPMQKRPSC